MRRYRNSKIIATLGPSSASFEQIESLYLAGADVFRLNFSHGTHDEHLEKIKTIRSIEEKHGSSIAIIQDLQGPKFRIGRFFDNSINLVKSQIFKLDLDQTDGDSTRVNLPHPEIYDSLRVLDKILLNDGKICLEVRDVKKDCITTVVTQSGELSNFKGVNIPGSNLVIDSITAKDKSDIEFGLNHGVDFIALSFVQRAKDIIDAKELINGRSRVMAKIEKPSAVDNLREIIEASDAVIVARGDLGTELPPENVPCIQKKVIGECHILGKPVIVATQMLESMVSSTLPTRAEASDVATAIFEGVDAVMLSAESATGKYPVESVSMMDRIIKTSEKDPIYKELVQSKRIPLDGTVANAITASAREVAIVTKIPVIVVFSKNGLAALKIARERPVSPVLCLTTLKETSRFLAVVWGVYSLMIPEIKDVWEMVERACKHSFEEGFATPEDNIAIIAGIPFGKSGGTNALRISKVKDYLDNNWFTSYNYKEFEINTRGKSA